jgi:hypothetical protein
MASIGHIKTTETIPHSVIDQEEKKKVNFQTGKIKVLFTIDIGTVQSGETRFLNGDPFDKQASNMSLQLSTMLFKLENSVTSSFNFRPIVFFVLVIS